MSASDKTQKKLPELSSTESHFPFVLVITEMEDIDFTNALGKDWKEKMKPIQVFVQRSIPYIVKTL